MKVTFKAASVMGRPVLLPMIDGKDIDCVSCTITETAGDVSKVTITLNLLEGVIVVPE